MLLFGVKIIWPPSLLDPWPHIGWMAGPGAWRPGSTCYGEGFVSNGLVLLGEGGQSIEIGMVV